MRIRLHTYLACALLLVVSCGDSIRSTTVSTERIHPEFRATADGSGTTRLNARLKTEGPTSETLLKLENGDRLHFHVDGEAHSPTPVVVYGQSEVYERELADEGGGTAFRVSLTRDGRTDAPRSTVTLPDPFEIDAPAATDRYSRSDDPIVVRIDNADPSARSRLDVRGECLEGSYRATFSGRTATIPPGALQGAASEIVESNDRTRCSARLTVRRVTEGVVDPALGGGSIEGVQKRVTSFKSLP